MTHFLWLVCRLHLTPQMTEAAIFSYGMCADHQRCATAHENCTHLESLHMLQPRVLPKVARVPQAVSVERLRRPPMYPKICEMYIAK